ncbi:T6SS immunity protein Tli4 family protein [Moellerella wisconsensis]|uniref:T6SS immunity protein Tli4 family protein n=1 Tax=Moellerella wisconsensis TaxID=158849 RepID=UPI001F4EFDF0|nr:T6SS immunity protein Tli4 family protein [Moellerella wisconsensis]UNH26949.1 T6SS immunity protein Tli4 family protein [Moellerella wisconsensis]
MVESLFSKTKPQCVGIYVVEVPESFNNGTHKATYDDFDIESQFIYPPAFKQRIELREQALRNQKSSQKNAPVLKEIIQLPDNQGVIFDRNISGQDDLGRILEAHVYINHIAFIITAEILDLSSPKYSERKKTYVDAGFTEVEMNNKPTKLAAMRSLISRLSGRSDHEVPTTKGVCIPNGFIADNGEYHKIVVGFSYKNDDFQFDINTYNTFIANGDSLFKRSAAVNDEIKNFHMKIFKKEALEINGIPIEALFSNGIQAYDKKNLHVYDFFLIGNEKIASKIKPIIKLEIDSQYKQTRYSEAQMVEIWDRIVGSLRYKPNTF